MLNGSHILFLQENKFPPKPDSIINANRKDHVFAPINFTSLSNVLCRMSDRFDGIPLHLSINRCKENSSMRSEDSLISCQCCSETVVKATVTDLEEIQEKLERHIISPKHCFASSINSLGSTDNEDIDSDRSQRSTSLLPHETTSPYRKSVCICRHTPLHTLSVGRLIKCNANLTSCEGYFHSSCCLGGQRICSTGEIRILGILLNNKKDVCTLCADHIMQNNNSYTFESKNPRHAESIISLKFEKKGVEKSVYLLVNKAFPEIKGMISQVEALVKYYSTWERGKRIDLCRSRLPKGPPTKINQTIDNCDRMRLAISHNLASILHIDQVNSNDNDDSIMDIICRFARIMWR